MTEKIEILKEKFKEFLGTLLMLCPAYNRFSRILVDLDGKSASEVAAKYPELYEEKLLPVLFDFLGVSVSGARISVSGIGSDIIRLINGSEEFLSREEIRKVLKEQIGLEISNPCKDYVKLCIEALKEKYTISLKLLEILSTIGSNYLGRILEEAKKEGLEIRDETELSDHLQKLVDLRLITISRGDYVSPVERYIRYVKELVV
jgi:hypothetical protein